MWYKQQQLGILVPSSPPHKQRCEIQNDEKINNEKRKCRLGANHLVASRLS